MFYIFYTFFFFFAFLDLDNPVDPLIMIEIENIICEQEILITLIMASIFIYLLIKIS